MRKEPTKTRVYSGRTYYLFMMAHTKAEAMADAARLRKNGYNARIHAGKHDWYTYSNPKTPKWYSGFFLTKRKK